MTTSIKGNATSTFGGGLDLGSNTITTTGSITGDISVDALSTASGSAPSYSARAWVQYHGSNGTVNGNGNVSSVTDNGTGDFTVNFTTAMADTNYSWAIGYAVNLGVGQRNRGFFELENISTGSLRVYQIDSSGNAWDISLTAVQVFR